ncbi:MAG TPA: noncanonical pyrimidine nucleotidase, YjjG family [Mariniphaga anaerophila]|uniref:Noncanonical pyrimidine nucleotidase, YjjG family n=1 Tax=Mariniphaga anaerophila TaxID=1484053 RepID=A0A831LPP1_9BACT|nr:noncanonical pyrimidine nucleotidase, YjjG family [Mariniphaga anaerophila]
MKKKYTHIFFDLDNTLWDFEQNSQIAMQKTLSHFKLNEKGIGFESFYDSYSIHNKKLWCEYRDGKVVKKELKELRFEQTFKELGITGIDPLEMNLFYLTEMPFQKKLVEGAVELLDYLTSKGYQLFIITNGFREVQYKKLEASGLKPFFTKVFISEDVKAPKPSPEIFEYAIKSANARKKSSLMIGDDPDVDILGALNFGIDAVLVDSGKHHTGRFTAQMNFFKDKFYVVNSLLELVSLLTPG